MEQKSLFKNTIYKAILSLFNIVIPIIIGPYIVRLLDIELYGIYNKVFSEFQIFLTFASFGIYTFGVREISKIRDDKEKVAKLFSNLCLISFITNFIVMIIYIIYSLISSSGITTTIYLIMIIQIIGNIFYIEFVNEALENYRFITIKTIIVKLLYFLSLILFVRKSDDIIIYSVIICLTVFLNNIISFIYAKKHIKFNFEEIEIKKYLKPMFLILIIANADLLYSQLDRVMLGKLVSDVSVTYYYIPYFLVSTIAAIPYSIINVSIPRLTYMLKNKSKEEYKQQLNKTLSSLLFIIVPMCLGMFVLSKEIILIYAGEKYSFIYPILMLSCLIRISLSIESVFVNLVMYPNNQEKQILKICLSYGLLNLVLNSILVVLKIFTPFTALITTSVAELLYVLTQKIYAKKKLDIDLKIFENNKRYFVLGLMFIPISLLIRMINLSFILNTIVIIIVCSLFYVGVLYLMKDENLLLILRKLKNKFVRCKNG